MANAHIIDGKLLAKKILEELRLSIAEYSSKRQPGLATVLVGDDKASALYVANKRQKAVEVGIKSIHHHVDQSIREQELLELINALNADGNVDGILVQLPLPKHLNEARIIGALDPKKDVDGIHPLNLGHLLRGEPIVVPCTPLGILHIIRSVKFSLQGKHAVIIGRSNIVGKPAFCLLLKENATVTLCHAYTKNLAEITRTADVVVVAVGKPKMITRDFLKPGAFVIDVGINRDESNKLVGDVDFLDVLPVASFITPVPGGVGPLTIAMLLQNTFTNFLRFC